MKGITPVVAVTLLIAVTVAAAGTFYTVLTSTQDEVQENAPDITFNADILNVESCWTSGGNVGFSIRNTDTQAAINNSEMDLLVTGTELDYKLEPQGLIGPQETFEVRFESLGSTDEVVENETQIFLGESSMTYTCYT
jgi:flagellin-like protein